MCLVLENELCCSLLPLSLKSKGGACIFVCNTDTTTFFISSIVTILPHPMSPLRILIGLHTRCSTHTSQFSSGLTNSSAATSAVLRVTHDCADGCSDGCCHPFNDRRYNIRGRRHVAENGEFPKTCYGRLTSAQSLS